MDLYIVRHAWAAERDDRVAGRRPAAAYGGRQERFAELAGTLVCRGTAPQVVGTSPWFAARTAQIWPPPAGRVKVVELDEFRPGSDLEGLLQWTAGKSRTYERIAWVGHAPDVAG